MPPQIPENLDTLSVSQLLQLSADIRTWAVGVLQNTDATAEDRALARELSGKREEVRALAASKKAAADADAAALAALAEEDEVDDEAEVETTTTAAETTTETTVGDEAEQELATKGATQRKFGAKGKVVAAGTPAGTSTLEMVRAYDNVAGATEDGGFESWTALTSALLEKAGRIRANSNEQFQVAGIKAKYPQDRVLGENFALNLAKFEPDEIQAALCAPATPYYGLACANVLRRPVFNSLPQFQAPRMKVSIPESPSLSDITTGYGQWTAAMDADSDSVKSACQTIACGTPTEYVMYGVYRCLTIKNMLAMSYPELVEAYLNRLGAAHARLAEQLLLNAMASGCVEIDAPALGYGGSVSIVTTILNYLALYQETERWDVPGMHIWLPRWVQWAMKMDLARRRRTDGGFTVPSDSQIDAMFREVGVTQITWYMDQPSYAVAIPAVASASNLNLLPASVQILIAPAGKFAIMDRGELAIGVRGNNIYRDNQSNSRNEFTMFFENFEGIVNTTSCPAHILDIPACWSGVQIDDIVINCQGRDEVGYQS